MVEEVADQGVVERGGGVRSHVNQFADLGWTCQENSAAREEGASEGNGWYIGRQPGGKVGIPAYSTGLCRREMR